jgi:hypothetical protein
MKNIFESVKKLYTSENKAKQHWMLISLILFILIPFICLSYLQSDSSTVEMQTILALSAVFGILSIIPFFALCGAIIDYYNGRLNNQTGLFDVSISSIKKGLKIFPLGLVWTIYTTCIILLPIAVIIPCMIILTKHFHSIIFAIPFFFLFALYIIAICLLVIPFISYIIIEYAKDYKYKKYLFNPLTICKYMKKAFKSTVITNLKLYVANIILNIANSIIIFFSIILLFMSIFFIVFFISIFNPNAEILENISDLCTIPIFIIVSVFIAYVQTILGLAVGDIYTKIYKTEIEGQENTEENKTIEEETTNEE